MPHLSHVNRQPSEKKTLDGFLCKIGRSTMVAKLLGRSIPAQSFIELILRAFKESSMGFPEASSPIMLSSIVPLDDIGNGWCQQR